MDDIAVALDRSIATIHDDDHALFSSQYYTLESNKKTKNMHHPLARQSSIVTLDRHIATNHDDDQFNSQHHPWYGRKMMIYF